MEIGANRSRMSTSLAWWCVALAASAGSPVFAEGQTNAAIDTVLFWGPDFTRNDSDTYDLGFGAGFVSSLGGDLGATGLTLSGYVGLASTTTPTTSTETVSGWASLAHVWQISGGYVSLGAGVAFDEDDGADIFLQYGFEHTSANSIFIQSYGSYSGIDDAVYSLTRLGVAGNAVRYGAEITYLDDSTSTETWRYGVFVGGIELGGDLSLTASVGYHDETAPGLEDGFFATLGFTLPLSLR